jgi:triosephosphate isomerase
MARKLIIGNWKMNPQSAKEAVVLFKGVVSGIKDVKGVDVLICPPTAFLSSIKSVLGKKIKLGAQDVSEETEGAYTGQVSAKMVASLGAAYTIVGHSEKRKAGDTDEIVNKKLQQALKARLMPILCIGESARDSHGEYLTFIKDQLHACLHSISKAQMKSIIVAYEPIWAISSNKGRQAIPEEFTEVRIFIRKILSDMYDPKLAHAAQILYGGSVGPEDAGGFLNEGQADGLLVGRNSLNAKKFSAIIAIGK